MDESGLSSLQAMMLIGFFIAVLSTTLFVFILGSEAKINDQKPKVESKFHFEISEYADKQIVRIRHIRGENIKLDNIEVIVDAQSCGYSARISDVSSNKMSDRTRSDIKVLGDKGLIDETSKSVGLIRNENTDEWSANDEIQFRINSNYCDFSETQINKLYVSVKHNPSNSIITRSKFTIRDK